MVTGVTKGYERKLELVGVGFRAQVAGKTLNLTLGFSHPVTFPILEGITMEDAEPDGNSSSRASIGRKSVRSLPRSAMSARRSPYKWQGV